MLCISKEILFLPQIYNYAKFMKKTQGIPVKVKSENHVGIHVLVHTYVTNPSIFLCMFA